MGYRFDKLEQVGKRLALRARALGDERKDIDELLTYVADLEWQLNSAKLRIEIFKEAGEETCPNGLIPDGPTCPKCGCERGASGIDGGTWVHIR